MQFHQNPKKVQEINSKTYMKDQRPTGANTLKEERSSSTREKDLS